MEEILNKELLKKLRNQKAWSQEELATASDLSLRTIQRIEKDGKASLESRKAIASAFDINVTDLDSEENTSAVLGEDEDNFYFRVQDGTKLSEIIGGAYAFRMNHDNPNNAEEAELLAGCAQSIQEWGDIWQDLEAGGRVSASFQLSQLISELEEKGFWVFGLRTTEEYPGAKGEKWPVGNIFLMRADNPKIIKLDLSESD